MHKRALLGTIVAAALSAGCIGENEAVVFVEPSVSSPEAAVDDLVLGATVSGSFKLELALGPRASGPSSVELGSVAITDAENKASVVPALSLISSSAFPVKVEPDSQVTVDFVFDFGGKTFPFSTRDALCLPAGVRIAGTIKDSLQDSATPFASATFKPAGCM